MDRWTYAQQNRRMDGNVEGQRAAGWEGQTDRDMAGGTLDRLAEGGWTDGWARGAMDRWMQGGMDSWTDRLMQGGMDGEPGKCRAGWTDRWMQGGGGDSWTDRWIEGGRTDGQLQWGAGATG